MNTLQQEQTGEINETVDNLLDAVMITYDDSINRGLQPVFIQHVTEAVATARTEVAQQCYLECLAVECGEGECARAIRTKFNLKGIDAK